LDIGLQIAATACSPSRCARNQLSNDLANTSTPGYKPDESASAQLRRRAAREHRGGSAVGNLDEGVALGKTYTNMNSASMQKTGNARLRSRGHGFFAVKTEGGGPLHARRPVSASAAGILTDFSDGPRAQPERRAREVEASAP